jgi:uncharacterized protein (DUF1810 family)
MTDIYNLQRFLDAQDGVIEIVYRELSSGRKVSHWMWFVFPQIVGLGRSDTARRFAISSRDEAIAYLDHPMLGGRLIRCTELVNSVKSRTIEEIFGYPDDLKFHSSMTLFAIVSQDGSAFHKALAQYFDGNLDTVTVQRLSG